jgi:RNA polymerase sigma-70 factor, ECF subfamily
MFRENKLTAPHNIGQEANLTYSQIGRLPDAELMELVKRGNHDAFAHLFDRYYRLVLSITLKILRDASEAEDLMQDVFFEIYRKAEQFDPEKGQVKKWILRYTYHRSFNRLEYLNVRQFYDPAEAAELENLANHYSPGPWRGLTPQECRRVIQHSLATLNEKQRMAIEMACFHGKNMQEIAAATGESIENVRHYYYRGVKKLKELVHDRSVWQEKRAKNSHKEAVNVDLA